MDEVKYFQVKNEQLMREFVRKFEGSIVERVEDATGVQMEVEEYDSLMINCAEETLQKTFKRRTNKNAKISEPVWMTGEIRDGIKKRKQLNRRKRNCRDEEREQSVKLYCQQKELVKQLIRK